MYKLIFSIIFIFIFVAFGQVCAFDKQLYVEKYPDKPAGVLIKNNDGLYMMANNIKLITNKNFLINPKEKRIYIFDVKLNLPNKDNLSLESMNFPLENINGNYYIDILSLSNMFNFSIKDNGDYYLLEHDKGLSLPSKEKKYNGIVGLGFSVAKNFSDLKKFDLNSSINTVCFTWFSLEDSFGNFNNNADIGVVNYLHKKGYRVWGLFNNKFDPKLTHKLFESKYGLENAINQIFTYALIYNLDGVNIDFENMDKSDVKNFDYFIEKLDKILKNSDIALSVDVTVPDKNSSWSLCYDRKTISEFSDYLILMTYDEFSNGSERAGPTASLSWMEKGLENTLKDVSSEKILLGIPFYTREWIESASGKILKVKPIDSQKIRAYLETNNLTPQFDDNYGLYHVSFYRYNLKHEMWFDNNVTMTNKLKLIHIYNLGGFAIWKLESGDEGIWSSFSNLFGYKLINIGGIKSGK